jgi:hypothetical protein
LLMFRYIPWAVVLSGLGAGSRFKSPFPPQRTKQSPLAPYSAVSGSVVAWGEQLAQYHERLAILPAGAMAKSRAVARLRASALGGGLPRSAAPSWRGRWRPSRRAHRPGRSASPACRGRSRRPRRRRACLGANATRVLDVDMCGGLRVGPEAGSESARTAGRRALREKAELIPSKPGSRARWGSQTLILPVRRETFRATNSGAYPRMALPRERPPQRRNRTTPPL